MKVNKYYKWIQSVNGYWYEKEKNIWSLNPDSRWYNTYHTKTLRAAKRMIRKWQKTSPEASFVIMNKYKMFLDIVVQGKSRARKPE
jgi:hypothetical protein